MGTAFKDNTSVRKIVDLHHLTSVTSIPHQAFAYMTALETCVIWEGVTQLQYRWNFAYDSSLRVLVWPSTLQKITMETARNCTNLTVVICKAETPPGYNTSSASMFARGTTSAFRIYVPDDSVDAYKAASGWSSYASKIVGKSSLPSEYAEYWP